MKLKKSRFCAKIGSLWVGLGMVGTLWGQTPQWIVQAGVSFGGPLPSIPQDSTSGTVFFTPSGGASFSNSLSKKCFWEVGVHFRGTHVAYTQTYRQDTNVVVELIPGMVDTLPTYYFADIQGEMRLTYLDVPLKLGFRPGKHHRISLGINPGFLISAKDTGTVRIQIGEGGFFEDQYQSFDNQEFLRNIDLGISLGYSFIFLDQFSVGCEVFRNFRALYQPEFFTAQGRPENPMFHTGLRLEAGWVIPCPNLEKPKNF